MFEKLLDSKLKVAVLVGVIIFIILSIIDINRADKPAKDRSAGTSFENAAGVALPPDTGAQAGEIESNPQNMRTGKDLQPAEGTPYVYKTQAAAQERLAIKEAAPAQIRSEAEMPPEIKELQTQMDNINRNSARPPQVIKAVRVRDDDSESSDE